MKITIIGGGGARVPLLTHGVLRYQSSLAVDVLSLWDTNPERERTIAGISRAMVEKAGASLRIEEAKSVEEALTDASFVISSIRVGGLKGRIKDETIALRNGTVGQETVGAGGCCLSLRTIPVMNQYATLVSRLAPKAWLLNFTNPVGVIHQAMLRAGVGDRVIGICDTPREHFESIAHAMGSELDHTYFDYFGLNHLGWVRRAAVNGRDGLASLFGDTERLSKVYRIPYFELDFLRSLELLPTEYLYFYYRPEHAFSRTEASGQTRGQLIEKLEQDLMRKVLNENPTVEAMVDAYDDYLARRNASYMAVETGQQVDDSRLKRARAELYQHAAGYERIALDVMEAIACNRPRIMPVDVPNRGAIPELEPNDAVEVPCVIDANGAHPLAVGRVPAQARDLLMEVKKYERLTAEAALSGSFEMAVQAMAANPIIGNRSQAQAIMADYRSAHSPHLDYLG